MIEPRLPRLVIWLLARVVPERTYASALADLEIDYRDAITTRGRAQACWWLARETGSLLLAYSSQRASRAARVPAIWMRDVQMVARVLRRRPGASLGAAAMLSGGLVAVLITAGLTSSLLLRPVSPVNPDTLRRIGVANRQGSVGFQLAYPELQVVRDHLAGAATVASVNLQPVVVRAAGADLQTMVEVVDGEYFNLTGMTLLMGRALLPLDDRPAAPPVVVLAKPLWRNRYASSPDVLGSIIELNGSAFTVVGVAQSLGSSSFLGASVDAWVPLAHADPLLNREWRTNLADRWFSVFALPSRSAAEVDARLETASNDLGRMFADGWRERRLQSAPGMVVVGTMRTRVAMVSAVLASLALLILCVSAANVGSVLLARAAADRRHAVIHLSIGSGRGALVRRLLLEGSALGIGGALIAVAIYMWARTRFAEITVLPTLAVRFDLPLDGALVGMVVAIGALTGGLLAIGPAGWIARLDPAAALNESDSRAGGAGFTRVRRGLVAAQVCLSLALLVGATLFTRSMNALNSVDVGFSRDGLVAMDFDLEPAGPSMAEMPALARQALERVEALPHVQAAAMSNRAPVDMSTPALEVRSDSADGELLLDVSFNLATTRYFDTVGLPLVAGRAFTEAEASAGADVVIVNQSLASRLWPLGDALDRAIYLVAERKAVRVVGVARDAKYRSLSEQGRPHFYRPTPPRLGLALLARSSGSPRETLRDMQRALDGVGPGLVGFFPRTFDDHIAIELAASRTSAAAASVLGTLALLLSGVGLYGIVSWFVELKTREIGIRMALGATRANVRALVVRQAVTAAVPGMIGGVVLAAGLGMAARSILYGVNPVDPLVIASAIAVLAGVVLVASYVPAYRATRVEPAAVLRQ
jgi:predicted permease